MAIRNRSMQNNHRDYDDVGTAQEVSAFKKGLVAISLETIRERLDSKTITRKWKRDLAEAEVARREDDEAVDDVHPARKKSGSVARWAAAAIIAVCSLIILYTMFEIWRR